MFLEIFLKSMSACVLEAFPNWYRNEWDRNKQRRMGVNDLVPTYFCTEYADNSPTKHHRSTEYWNLAADCHPWRIPRRNTCTVRSPSPSYPSGSVYRRWSVRIPLEVVRCVTDSTPGADSLSVAPHRFPLCSRTRQLATVHCRLWYRSWTEELGLMRRKRHSGRLGSSGAGSSPSWTAPDLPSWAAEDVWSFVAQR